MKFLVFLGTVRNSTPPKPARLGERVSKACIHCLQNLYPEQDIELIDALDYPMDNVFKPHFAYAKNKAPEALNSLADKIKSADGYIMISPEYNHSVSPALANLLNHFGSSLFAYKPSAIVTYSAGQWGGMRAAVGMRTYLSELGCLPVSAMIHVPKAQEAFNETGQSLDDVSNNDWHNYFARTFSQLMWWAQAAKDQRIKHDPNISIGNFTKTPTERNAP